MNDKNVKNEIKDELQSLSPLLASKLHAKKENDVPFRYFDRLPDQVLDKIQADKKPHWVEAFSWLWKPRYRLVVAVASIALMLSVSVFLFTNQPTMDRQFMALNDDEIKNYLMNQAGDLDDAQLELLPVSKQNELIPLSTDEMNSVLDEYLYQINDENLN